jgi:hypothetical protein
MAELLAEPAEHRPVPQLPGVDQGEAGGVEGGDPPDERGVHRLRLERRLDRLREQQRVPEDRLVVLADRPGAFQHELRRAVLDRLVDLAQIDEPLLARRDHLP